MSIKQAGGKSAHGVMELPNLYCNPTNPMNIIAVTQDMHTLQPAGHCSAT